ncbi:MAG TPA: PilZ domain-containing protein [Terriglobales bacterium]|nr:PilZ domain-containing protein [Terriglobales bacterium]
MRSPRQNSPEFTPKRRWPRQKVDVPVRLVLHGYNQTFLVEGCGNELSDGGMLVFAGLQLPVGREVEVEFLLPRSGEPLRIPATIRDRDRYLYGLEFTGNPELQDQIARLRQSLR